MTRRSIAVGVVAVFAITTISAIWLARRNDVESPIVPKLMDETASSGIAHVYDGGFPFFVGGGVATFDCSGDSMPELYLAGGENKAALYVNESVFGGTLRFTSKPSPITDLSLVIGAYPLDVDGDSFLDLVVLRYGGNVILRGLGDCEFEDVTTSLGIDPGNDWTVSFAATWEKGAQLPTLVFGSYLVPDSHDCGINRMWRPTGKRYTAPLLLPGHCTLSLLFSSWNHDGRVDLRVSNDRNYDREASEQLWRIRPGETPREYGPGDGWRNLVIWGMGIASQDLTGDGKPEIFLTSQSDNKLQTLVINAVGPAYRDIALERGVTAHRPYVVDGTSNILPSTAWHPEFDDVNNDGVMDIFVTKGNVEGQVDYAAYDPNNLLLGQKDGTFVERGGEATIANGSRSRGAALADLNLDGMLDLVVVNRRVSVEVRRNVGTGTTQTPRSLGRWVELRLREPGPNSNAVGAWIEVRIDGGVITRELTVGGGHASGEAGWIHFGIGNSVTADVRVTFPGLAPGVWQKVESNTFYEISLSTPTPTKWSPGD